MSLSFEVFDLDFPAGSKNKSAVLVTGENGALLVDAGFTRADGTGSSPPSSTRARPWARCSSATPTPTSTSASRSSPTPSPTQDRRDADRHRAHRRLVRGQAEGLGGARREPADPAGEDRAAHGDFIEVDGSRFELRGGSAVLPDRHYLWNAEHRAIIGGVLLFQQEHVWVADTATPEQRAAWIELLDQMQALDPALVVAGHRLPDTANDASAIDYTRTYLRDFERILERLCRRRRDDGRTGRGLPRLRDADRRPARAEGREG